MRKINYGEKSMKKLLDFLSAEEATYGVHPYELEVEATIKNEARLFREINKIIANTKYMVQKNIKTFRIVVFNGSL